MHLPAHRHAFVAAIAMMLASASAAGPVPQPYSHAQVARGQYLVRAGDCESCHTAEGDTPFAGGRPIPTPFGTLYSTNITTDPTTGIGQWSDADFYRAMHEGVAPGGRWLYPAFPYLWFTHLSHEDVDSIHAYLQTLDPVYRPNREPRLPWPLSWRPVMGLWNAMFFRRGSLAGDPAKGDLWNRGAYLVEGAGHCAACHTPHNLAGAPERDEAFDGGHAEGWFASDLGPDQRAGLGTWSNADIVEYLKTGSNTHAAAGGPMAEVVAQSTHYLTDTDLQAIAVYLKALPGAKAAAGGSPAPPMSSAMTHGEAIYVDDCAGCHRKDGAGIPGVFPRLRGSQPVQADDATSVLQVLLDGARMPSTQAKVAALGMPAFAWKLTDTEIAEVATYIRNAWGNVAPPVAAGDVEKVRRAIEYAKLQ